MKTLYIHGLDSYPKPEKLEILKKHKLDPVALHLNYRETLGIYETLKDAAIRKDVKFIVGSSVGGYLAFLLSNDLGIPCLLFNPAMDTKDHLFYSVMPEIKKSSCNYRFVVLGEKDKTVDPDFSRKTFIDLEKEGFENRVITCEWLGHQIDLTTFEGMLNWALGGLKVRGCPNVPK